MSYRKLSEQIAKLANPQRSDVFVRMFRDAIREGDFEGAYLPERFQLPKQYSTRGSDETYTKEARDMIFDATPEFDEWFDQVNRELSAGRRGAAPKATIENIEAGVVDFRALAEATRAKMQASFKKGQSLGKARAKTKRK